MLSGITLLAAFAWGGGEIFLIFAIILLLFGGAKLPSLARGLGQSIKEFKKASKEGDDPETKPAAVPPAAAVEAKKTEHANTPGPN